MYYSSRKRLRPQRVKPVAVSPWHLDSLVGHIVTCRFHYKQAEKHWFSAEQWRSEHRVAFRNSDWFIIFSISVKRPFISFVENHRAASCISRALLILGDESGPWAILINIGDVARECRGLPTSIVRVAYGLVNLFAALDNARWCELLRYIGAICYSRNGRHLTQVAYVTSAESRLVFVELRI